MAAPKSKLDIPIHEILPPIDDPIVQAILASLKRAAYTLPQHRAEVYPGSRTSQYEEARAGRLRFTKRGASTFVLAIDAARHLALLRRESEPPPPAARAPTAPSRGRKRKPQRESASSEPQQP